MGGRLTPALRAGLLIGGAAAALCGCEARQVTVGKTTPATARTPVPTMDDSRSPEPVGAPLEEDYLGAWHAADGRSLVVIDPPAGGVVLEFTGGETPRRLRGSVTAEGLRFVRDGVAEAAVLLRPGDSSRSACLSVSDAETYCRPVRSSPN